MGVGTRRTGDLAALEGLQLYIVDDGPDGHGAQRHGVARLHVGAVRGDHLVASLEALRSQDVGDLPVRITDQGDKGRAVRIILNPVDGADDVELATLEVHHAVKALGTAATETNGYASAAAPAAGL